MTVLAELHCHLEGATRPALALAKAEKYAVSIDDLVTDDGESYVWTDFTTFLAAYDRIAGLFRAPEDFHDLAYDHFSSLAGQGAIYAEVFLSPDHMGRNGSYRDSLDAVIEGYREAHGETGIVGRFIPLAVRNFGPERAIAAAEQAVRHLRPEVTGFGLAGDERVHRPADFAAAFDIASEAGLACTAHAGELAGPDSVRAALDALPVARIGHGVRAIEDMDLVRRLADEAVVLEVCPGSNIALGIYPDYAGHPLKTLMEAGVRVTLNSDDPPFFRTTLVDEYRKCGAAIGLSGAQMADFTETALAAAFVDEATRQRLLHTLRRPV